ncbi:Succinate dehydrogenase cytochrome b subunit [Enhygromyxa salina]|uniref:Succinate dehydrogenase cytochrome b subunit n=1 Tax=Enhygromyxa salina TaxID=215803 RepID=A0A0C1ZMP0_9BACT|nr:succinate dehydrogenase cytochrome b subunit [Enhygromyxa salina]KIG12303.1 Succinate dehydrogenase cytochrome b subunit [Enhygromyxa salina]
MSSATPTSAPPFDRLVKALTSTISLKIVMALTGLAGVGFILFHMAGNLQVFLGRDAYNDYAEFMQGLGALKWVARGGLLTVLGLHVGAAVVLIQRNQRARPERYAGLEQKRTSLAAMYMAELGMVLLAFIVYHIAHFTMGVVSIEFGGVDYYALQQVTEESTRRDLYAHFIVSFQQPGIAITYIVANIALAAHLAHGVTSTFKTAGIAVGRWKLPFEVAGPAIGVIVGLGNISMPLAIWAGFIGGH